MRDGVVGVFGVEVLGVVVVASIGAWFEDVGEVDVGGIGVEGFEVVDEGGRGGMGERYEEDGDLGDRDALAAGGKSAA